MLRERMIVMETVVLTVSVLDRIVGGKFFFFLKF